MLRKLVGDVIGNENADDSGSTNESSLGDDGKLAGMAVWDNDLGCYVGDFVEGDLRVGDEDDQMDEDSE